MPRHLTSALLIVASIVSFALYTPIAHAASDSIVWERGDQIVQLAKQDDASAPPNDHPTSTTAREIEAMLEILRMRYAGEDSDLAPVAVFTKEEIGNLGKAVATGLGRAEPSQDVLFHLIGTRELSRGAFARRNRVSAGRIFYRDGKLNILFGQVQTPHRKKNVYGQTDQDFYPRNYGSRMEPAEHNVVFLTNNMTQLHRSGTGERDDWIVIRPIGSPGETPEPLPTSANITSAASVGPEMEAAPISPQLPTGNTVLDDDQPGATAIEPAASPSADIESRLRALKRLRDKGLISEDAYQAKVKEILEDL